MRSLCLPTDPKRLIEQPDASDLMQAQLEKSPGIVGNPVTTPEPKKLGRYNVYTSQIPLRVEVILTKDWERLLFDANLAQYLPCGEKIGAIPAGQTSGAWARMIGLALMNTWRREPQKAIYSYASAVLNGPNPPADEEIYSRLEAMQAFCEKAGLLKITRREVLYHYTPAKTNPHEMESSRQRAIDYWLQALKHLHRRGIVAKAGEAVRTKKDIERKLPRYNWLDDWLDEVVDIRPGPAILPAIETQAKAIPKPKRRELGPPKRRKKSI